MATERFMRHHYGASGYVRPGTKFCARCNHPQDWHRHDDASGGYLEGTKHEPGESKAKFRCIGYDCEVGGPPVKNGCGCPDFLDQKG